MTNARNARNVFTAIFIALIVPIAFFLYFDYPGPPKRPKVKRFFPLGDELSSPYSKEVNDTLWHVVPPFSLTGHSGKKITHETFEDKIYVVDFFFTRCPGICPKLTAAMGKLQEQFKEEPDIMLLSHTVDPDYDTPKVLAKYAKRHHADSTKWHFVTGSMDSLTFMSKKGYFLSLKPGTEETEAIDHSGRLVLVDKDRIIRGFYHGTDPEEVNRLMEDIYILKMEYPRREKLEYNPNPEGI